jgi:NADPH:quinone reductase
MSTPSMQRVVCRSFDAGGNGVVVDSAPIPTPGPGEVLIRTTAANVSFVDRLIVRGGYQVRPPLPFTPGAVGAGEVVEAGDGVTHLATGTSVVVLLSGYGTWATHVVAPAWAVVPIPPNVADELAVAAIEAYGTASYALEERGGLRAGERLLVLGASGAVGAAAVEIAVHLDAEVIAVTSDPATWDHHAVRPHAVVDRRSEPLRPTIKARYPGGVHVVLDPVGGDLAEAALRSLGPLGRYLVVGFASGAIPALPTNQILLRNRTVVGVEWATWITANSQHLARTLEVVLNRLGRGVLHPPKPTLVALDELPAVLREPSPGAGLIRTVVVPSLS